MSTTTLYAQHTINNISFARPLSYRLNANSPFYSPIPENWDRNPVNGFMLILNLYVFTLNKQNMRFVRYNKVATGIGPIEPYVLADLYAWLESHSGFTRIPVVMPSSNSSSSSSATK